MKPEKVRAPKPVKAPRAKPEKVKARPAPLVQDVGEEPVRGDKPARGRGRRDD